MGLPVKIIKNITPEDMIVLGFVLEAQKTYEIPSIQWSNLSEEEDLLSKIDDQKIAVFDGTTWLIGSKAKEHILLFDDGLPRDGEGISSFLENSTTSKDWVRLLRLRRESLSPGIYLVEWSYCWKHSIEGFAFKARVMWNEYDMLWMQEQKPVKKNAYTSIHMRAFKQIISSEDKDQVIDVDFCSESGHTATVRGATLTIKRVR